MQHRQHDLAKVLLTCKLNVAAAADERDDCRSASAEVLIPLKSR
jgi:hypothetical protein